ncbi:MAG TPA: CpsD/CapB family tyrosine-protein kinase [Terriglobales bacterium]|nr:CpsD/CapB family tyrosine-protein kinase [Terriglobales bacterium]
MGFFYQAIKRATGQPVEEATPEPRFENAAVAASVATSRSSATGVEAPPAVNFPASTPAAPKQTFVLKGQLEKLVAFLTPPVLDPNILAMEQCRVLRTRLWEVMRARKIKTLLVTSAIPEEGKTVLAVNLAFALAQLENVRVLLVDADLRKPSVSNFLKMTPPMGLNTYLRDDASFHDVCWKINSNLDVVPSLSLMEESAELLHGSRMQMFLQEACANYDVVLVDAAPLIPVADTQVLAPLLDGAVLACRAHSTPAELVKQSADMLGSKLLGTILNGAKRPPQSRYYTGYLGKSTTR